MSVRLTFKHRASCVFRLAFRYSPENAFYIRGLLEKYPTVFFNANT